MRRICCSSRDPRRLSILDPYWPAGSYLLRASGGTCQMLSNFSEGDDIDSPRACGCRRLTSLASGASPGSIALDPPPQPFIAGGSELLAQVAIPFRLVVSRCRFSASTLSRSRSLPPSPSPSHPLSPSPALSPSPLPSPLSSISHSILI